MATKTQTPPSSFSRVRFGFGHKHPRTDLPPPEPPEYTDDGDWYIPYNGPYELPPTAPPSQNRDSWTQLLGSVLGNVGSAKSSDAGHGWSDGRTASGHQHATSALPSSGAYSSHPYRIYTPSNAAGAPGPPATGSQARGAVSQPFRGGRPTMATMGPTAFANIDNTGGVGESPTPVQRSSPPHASPPPGSLNRLSFGSFLTFGGSSRKSRSDSVPPARQPSAKRFRNGTPTPDPLQPNRATTLGARPSRPRSPLSLGQTVEHRPRQRSHTLMGTSSTAQPSGPSHESSANPYYTRESPLSTHPYAYTFPSRTEAPKHAPTVPPSAYHSSDKGKGVDRSYQYPRPPQPDTLNKTEVPAHLKPASRTSLFKTISTPNLHNFSRGIPANKPASSRGKSRWLSPETWCDALLFPRPRFMEYVDDEPLQSSSRHRRTTLTRSSEVHTTREPPKSPQMALRASHSATNLRAPNFEASRGPPRAEPMLIPRGESFNLDGQSSPARPRSFALDDLALPSPVPSLARVLEMGASFDRERATWKAHAARSLQSSRLTRSLGRSRSQSVGRARAQLKEMGGVGFLATKTLLGNQFAAPIIHQRTPSGSTQTQHTQTRSGASHARTASSSGISRAGSRGKAALRAATGLCVSDDKMSPRDERFDIVSRNEVHTKDAHTEPTPRKHDVGVGPSPSPPVTDPSNVGLALSSPPPSAEGDFDEPFMPAYIQDHPYAQGSQSPSRRSHARSSSDYAGPHPSAVSIAAPAAALTSDMSARHRLPPHAALHPYASVPASSSAASPQHPPAILPVVSTESHQAPRSIPGPPNRRPQLTDARETPRGTRHAYALSNYLTGEPLAFVDALLSGPQRRLSADSGLGDSEQHSEAPASAMPLFSPLPNLILTTPSEQRRLDPARDSTFLSLNSTTQTIGSSPPETLNPPVFTASMLSYSFHSAQASFSDELLQASRASSPHQSPQPFSSIEDLERYRDLFYRPRASGSSRTPSSEHRRVLSRDTGSLVGLDTSSNSRVSGGSGLTMLTRQLSTELETIQDIRRLDGTGGSHSNPPPPHMWGLRYGGLRGDDGMGSRTDPNAVLSIASESDMNPDATTLPLSLHQNLDHQSLASLTLHIPQDVASQTSSVLDRSEMEDHHDELLRMGTVEAVSTPAATVPTHRLSFAGDVHGSSSSRESLHPAAADDDEHLLLPPMLLASSLRHGSQTSLIPAGLPSATTDVTRSSYQTDGTGTSRISGLSDFPAPPTQTVVSSDRVEFLKSYFGSDTHSRPVSQTGDSPKAEPAPRSSSLSSSSSSRLQRPALGGPSRVSHDRSHGEAGAH